MLALGVEVRTGQRLGSDFTFKDLSGEGFAAVYLALGAQRSVRLPHCGTAEEGFVVLVRPELEVDGKRLVTVDAQAARLRALEPMRLPEVELEAATITVPRHHPPQRKLAAAPLGDAEALLLTMPAPEGAGRVVAVMVRVRRIP